MSIRDPHVRNRLLLWLVSGLGIAALAWGRPAVPSCGRTLGKGRLGLPGRTPPTARSAMRPRPVRRWPSPVGWRPRRRSGIDDDSNALAIPAPGPPAVAALAHREHEEADDDDVLFAAMERLERRMAAGMIRARDSVVTLEYKAADGPEGARRVATGVVVNGHGDVLSVRIDRPVPAPGETDESASARITARRLRPPPSGVLDRRRSRHRVDAAADRAARRSADPTGRRRRPRWAARCS